MKTILKIGVLLTLHWFSPVLRAQPFYHHPALVFEKSLHNVDTTRENWRQFTPDNYTRSVYYLDTLGRVTEVHTAEKTKPLRLQQQYFYKDTTDKPIRQVSYFIDGTLEFETEFEYEAQGNLVRTATKSQYESMNQIVHLNIKDGRTVSARSCPKGPGECSEIRHEYPDALSEIRIYYDAKGKKTLTRQWHRDTFENQTAFQELDGQDNLQFKFDRRYTYDRYGNWTECISQVESRLFSEPHQYTSYTSRTIAYAVAAPATIDEQTLVGHWYDPERDYKLIFHDNGTAIRKTNGNIRTFQWSLDASKSILNISTTSKGNDDLRPVSYEYKNGHLRLKHPDRSEYAELIKVIE